MNLGIKNLKKRLASIKDKNPWLYLLWHELLRARGRRELKKFSDIEAINRLYYAHAGRFPDLKYPTLFSEKLQWIKLHHQDPLMARCADKFEVRSYLQEKGYSELLNDLIASYADIEDFDQNALPSKFVLKGSHGSGWNIICHDRDSKNWRPWKRVMKSWLNHNIFWNGREFVYKEIVPRMICEKYLEDSSGGLADYKFFCFNGEPRFLQVNQGRDTNDHTQNFYDLDWKLQPFGKDLLPNPGVKINCPENFDRMVEIARDLAQPFPFVRADFYNVNGKVYFGELTFFPKSGMPDFVPSEYDAIVGEMLILPQKRQP